MVVEVEMGEEGEKGLNATYNYVFVTLNNNFGLYILTFSSFIFYI